MFLFTFSDKLTFDDLQIHAARINIEKSQAILDLIKFNRIGKVKKI
jgi:hypothetical protein